MLKKACDLFNNTRIYFSQISPVKNSTSALSSNEVPDRNGVEVPPFYMGLNPFPGTYYVKQKEDGRTAGLEWRTQFIWKMEKT